MFLTLILAVAAGALVPMVEPHITRLMAGKTPKGIEIEGGEYRTITFALLLLVVAIVRAGSDGTAVTLMIGGLIGLFLMRLIPVVKGLVMQYPDKSKSAEAPAADITDEQKPD